MKWRWKYADPDYIGPRWDVYVLVLLGLAVAMLANSDWGWL